MAVHLCAQSLGRLHHVFRPASTALTVLTCHSLEFQKAQPVRENKQVTPFGHLPLESRPGPALTAVDSRKAILAAGTPWHSRTLGTLAALSAPERDGSNGAADSSNAAPQRSKQIGGNVDDQPKRMRRREKPEEDVRRELLGWLRRWPPDIDLDANLGWGEVGGKIILNRTLKSVLYQLTFGHAAQDGGQPNGIQGYVPFAAPMGKCDPANAHRAVNIFRWRRKNHLKNAKYSQQFSDIPLRELLHPVTNALRGANLPEELRALWTECKELEGKDQNVLATFQHSFFHLGLHDDVIAIFEEARCRGWPLTQTAASLGIRALEAKGSSREEIWEFYKTWVEKERCSLNSTPAVVALLEAGISVRDLQSLEYTDDDAFRGRMILALSDLGRSEEARILVHQFLDPEKKGMHLGVFLMVLQTFIKLGYVKEARRLAFEQLKFNVRLDGAFIHQLMKSKNAIRELETYRTLEAIDGLHKTSKRVQGLLITQCYARLPNTIEDMYQTYLYGQQLKGWFNADVYSTVIKRMASEDWAAEAEAVLGDYYAAREMHSQLEPLEPYAFHALGNMYLRSNDSRKLVLMVRQLVSKNLTIEDKVIRHWGVTMKSLDLLAEADELWEAEVRLRDRSSGKRMRLGSARRTETGGGRETEARTSQRNRWALGGREDMGSAGGNETSAEVRPKYGVRGKNER